MERPAGPYRFRFRGVAITDIRPIPSGEATKYASHKATWLIRGCSGTDTKDPKKVLHGVSNNIGKCSKQDDVGDGKLSQRVRVPQIEAIGCASKNNASAKNESHVTIDEIPEQRCPVTHFQCPGRQISVRLSCSASFSSLAFKIGLTLKFICAIRDILGGLIRSQGDTMYYKEDA